MTISMSETSSFALNKPLADSTTLLESHATQVGKALADAVISEDADIEFGKALSDTPTVTESLSRAVAFIRTFQNSTSVSDDAVLLSVRTRLTRYPFQNRQTMRLAKRCQTRRPLPTVRLLTTAGQNRQPVSHRELLSCCNDCSRLHRVSQHV